MTLPVTSTVAGRDERAGCATIARACGEPCHGTAATTPAVLLLEQPGPWGAGGLLECDLDPELGAAIADRAKQAEVKVLLIRRAPGRYQVSGRTLYLVHTGRPAPWMEQLELDSPAALLDLDLSRLQESAPPGLGEPVGDPLLAVCTHGRKDPCCAEYGRPVVRALRAGGSEVWECSHVGGDRFAANVVWFPAGVVYGQVTPEEAPALAEAAGRGELDPARLRGRTADEAVVQAADALVRRELGLVGLDDLVPEGVREVVSGAEGPERPGVDVVVRFRQAGQVVEAGLAVRVEAPRPTTCHAAEPVSPRHHALVSLRRHGDV